MKNRFSRWPLSFQLEGFYFFIYKLPPCLLSHFESIGLLVQEKKRKIDFQDHCRHLRYPIFSILAILIYKSPRCFLSSFESWPFGSGEEAAILQFG